MDELNRQRNRSPLLIAIISFTLSIIIWIFLRHGGQISSAFENFSAPYDSYVDVLSDVSVAILIGLLAGFVQLARQSARSLKQTNAELINEISERIKGEAARQKLEMALLQGQKLQAIGTLAGGIAHDFNNLLYAIIGYVEIVRDDVDKTSLVYKNLGKVLDAAHRGQELVSSILAFSRRQHHAMDILNLNQTIDSVLSLLIPAIPSSVIIQYVADVNDATILGNQTQIHQVLVNIINNAVHAMDDEGVINIHLYLVPKHDPYLKHFPEIADQNYYRIDITDTGHGMDPSTIERIFEPFFTTKEVGKGTGLGLSIAHSIMKEHQGEIAVTSQPGHGTTFSLLLPEQSK